MGTLPAVREGGVTSALAAKFCVARCVIRWPRVKRIAQEGKTTMFARSLIGAMTLAVALATTNASAQVFDPSKYPDIMGQWKRPPGVANQWDTSKPPRRGQEPPLTPEYQAVFEANLADQALGGQGSDPTYTCIPDGMPRAMTVIFPRRS